MRICGYQSARAGGKVGGYLTCRRGVWGSLRSAWRLENPLRRYQALRSFDVSPQLPAGYATMVVAALVPPVWRRVMDHRVLAHYGGDLDLANVHPPARRRLRERQRRRPAGLPEPTPR